MPEPEGVAQFVDENFEDIDGNTSPKLELNTPGIAPIPMRPPSVNVSSPVRAHLAYGAWSRSSHCAKPSAGRKNRGGR